MKELDDWILFGVGLGVPLSELRRIESARGTVKQCKAETIQYWLDNNADASWIKIAQTLELVDQLMLAIEVKRNYLWKTCELEQEGVYVACLCACVVCVLKIVLPYSGEESATTNKDLSPSTTANTTTTFTTEPSTCLATAPSSDRSQHIPLTPDGDDLVCKAEVSASTAVVEKIINLKGIFSHMLTDVRKISANYNLSIAQQFLNDFFETDEYSKYENFDKLLHRLVQQRKIDMFSINQLQNLVTCFKDSNLSEVVKKYEAEKNKFLQDTKVLHFQQAVVSSVPPVLPSGKAFVTIKIPRRLARQLSMKDIEELALKSFEKECYEALVQIHATSGSVVIMWFIPIDLITKLEQLVDKNSAIVSEAGVEEVTVDGKRVFPVPQFKVITTTVS